MADILIVDDDESIAESVADILSIEGHVFRIGNNGAEGLKHLSARLPDLIVLDVEMPVLTGPEMAARLLIEDAGRERIPIVLLSGAANLGRISAMVGTPYYLAKPCAVDMFLEFVARALREKIAPSPRVTPDHAGSLPR